LAASTATTFWTNKPMKAILDPPTEAEAGAGAGAEEEAEEEAGAGVVGAKTVY
jgi:hypothetical protein